MVIHLFNTGNDTILQSAKHSQAVEQQGKKGGKNGSSILASTLNLVKDPIQARKDLAQKRAMKLVQDEFKSDKKLDQVAVDSKKRVSALLEEKSENIEQVETAKNQLKDLKESMGIEDGSQEQKDFDILLKKQNNIELSDKELSRLNEMGPQTEYQSRGLKLEEAIKYFTNKSEENASRVVGENKMVVAMSLERVKLHGMVDNQKMAEEINKNASKEQAYSMIMEGKDNIEEDLEEKIEDAEKIKEEKQKEEEQSVKKEQEKSETDKQIETLEESSDQLSSIGTSQDKLKKDLQKLTKLSNLLSEDLKGIEVDQSV